MKLDVSNLLCKPSLTAILSVYDCHDKEETLTFFSISPLLSISVYECQVRAILKYLLKKVKPLVHSTDFFRVHSKKIIMQLR